MEINFLVYYPRSGSTMVAERLSRKENGVAVLPEFRTPSYLLLLGERRTRQMDAEALFNQLKRDDQISNLGLTDADLLQIADAENGSAIVDIVLSLCQAYCDKNSISTDSVLIKNGTIVHFWRAAIHSFPASRFVHVYRDPRGAISSMLHTPDRHSRGTMGRGDAIACSRRWTKVCRDVSALSDEFPDRLMEVRYEDVLVDEAETLRPVAVWLGAAASDVVIDQDGSLSKFQVPENERSIHKLVGQAPDAARMTSWQKDLSGPRGIAIESLTKDGRIRYGYQNYYQTKFSGPVTVLFFLTAWTEHLFRRFSGDVGRALRSAVLLIRDRDLLTVKIAEFRHRNSR